jgi:LPXTG-motif cell wall-anchored protein
MTKGASGGGSKAWIAGAVVGPIVGLALVGALFWFLLRRRKNRGTTPQQGSATMTSVDPSQPPAGVGGFTDAKPQFAQPQQTYANQSALAAQQGYASLPLSPAPHYNDGATPYNAPGSPPPQQAYFGNDGKIEYTGAVLGGASELVGEAGGATSPSAHATTNGYTAELGGQLRQSEGPGLFGPSELPTNSSNPMPTR